MNPKIYIAFYSNGYGDRVSRSGPANNLTQAREIAESFVEGAQTLLEVREATDEELIYILMGLNPMDAMGS